MTNLINFDDLEKAIADTDEKLDVTLGEIENCADKAEQIERLASDLQTDAQDARMAAEQAQCELENATMEISELEDTIDDQNERIEELEKLLSEVGNDQIIERLRKVEGIIQALWQEIETAHQEGEGE